MDIIRIRNIARHSLLKTDDLKQFYNLYLTKKLVLHPCELIESAIEFDKLIFYLKEIEETRIGASKSKFNSAYTGIDSNGNSVSYSALLLWVRVNHNDNYLSNKNIQDYPDLMLGKPKYILYKYNFDPNLIPLNDELKIKERLKKINNILE